MRMGLRRIRTPLETQDRDSGGQLPESKLCKTFEVVRTNQGLDVLKANVRVVYR